MFFFVLACPSILHIYRSCFFLTSFFLCFFFSTDFVFISVDWMGFYIWHWYWKWTSSFDRLSTLCHLVNASSNQSTHILRNAIVFAGQKSKYHQQCQMCVNNHFHGKPSVLQPQIKAATATVHEHTTSKYELQCRSIVRMLRLSRYWRLRDVWCGIQRYSNTWNERFNGCLQQ